MIGRRWLLGGRARLLGGALAAVAGAGVPLARRRHRAAAREWGLSFVDPRRAAIAVYLHMAAFGDTVVSGVWSLVNERFDHTSPAG